MRTRFLVLVVLASLAAQPGCKKAATPNPRAVQLARILKGDSPAQEVEVGKAKIKVGDKVRVPEWESVQAIEENGQTVNKVVEYGGTGRVLGFTEGLDEALLEYSGPGDGKESAETFRFFLPVEEVREWDERFGRLSPERARLRTEVKRITAMKGRLEVKPTEPGIETIQAGARTSLPEPLEPEAVNTEPAVVSGKTLVFRDEGPFDVWKCKAGLPIMVVGFSDDSKQALVRFIAPSGPADPILSSPFQFFVPVSYLARVLLLEELTGIQRGGWKIKEVEAEGKVLKPGTEAKVKNALRAKVVNLVPVKQAGTTYQYRLKGDLQELPLAAGGTMKLIDFTSDRKFAVVEYRASGEKGDAAPQVFMTVEEFAKAAG